jgi:hypothetical protein
MSPEDHPRDDLTLHEFGFFSAQTATGVSINGRLTLPSGVDKSSWSRMAWLAGGADATVTGHGE